MKKIFATSVLAVVFMFASWTALANQPTNIETTVKQIAAEYENRDGVDCIVVEDGASLTVIKQLFKQKFGKDFMKGVTSMVIIDYSKASNETRTAIRKRIDAFSATLQVFNITDGEEIKCFASVSNSNETTNISNLMFLMENSDNRMFVYMGGVINVDKLDLQF